MANLYGAMTATSATSRFADFYSDMRTKPSRAMMESALAADLGDEQAGGDPTTVALCRRVADLLGKDDAILMNSGTMCNEVALRVHCRPGDEIVCDQSSHLIHFECGGPAAFAGAMPRPISGERGMFSPEQLMAAIRPRANPLMPETALVSVEQTVNLAGGAVWPVQQLAAVAAVARNAQVATHMDGARLLNACVKTGIAASDFARGYDSVWIDFTKSLGCPWGAVMAGSVDFIARARRIRQMIGGGLRQSGFMAALCLYALDHNVERLAADHQLAKDIGGELKDCPLVSRVLPVETNIVIVELAAPAPTAIEIVDQLAKEGIGVGAFGERLLRLVTHLNVDSSDGERLCSALRRRLT
jgi:threonine aldolase